MVCPPPSFQFCLRKKSETDKEKCEKLRRLNVFGRLRGYIYNELLAKIYYPRFLQSYQVPLLYAVYMYVLVCI